MAWFLYLLECANGAVYTGIAVDVEARLAQHKSGKGAKYTRANPPKKILATRKFRTKGAALKEEWRVKQLPAKEKHDYAKKLRSLRTLKTIFLSAILPAWIAGAAICSPSALASPDGSDCNVRVMPGFDMEFVQALNARGYRVIVDPDVKSDDFPGFLSRYVRPGEYGILVGGILQGGFELWRRDDDKPVLARWEWFRPSVQVLRLNLPQCADFLKEFGRKP